MRHFETRPARRFEGWGLTVRKQWQSGLFLSDIVWVFFSMIYFRLFMQYFPIDGFYRDFSAFAFRGGLCLVRDVACRDVRIVRSNMGEDDV
ncbi:hypothetical protein [Neisseria polysaccharea]|uniref:hypothetical protein n=1 Tax=Neisseria polysaccharea TaxID=489 RepID=UPI0027E0DD8C|nr:hypothetical protein [Neisseria polysaccharea]